MYFCVKFTQLKKEQKYKLKNMSYTYQYPHPAVATDCVIFGFDGKELKILLIRRGIDPYKGQWAFPGGFMRIDETAEACAKRELEEETKLNIQVLKQLGAFSGLNRDPRERVISIAFYALVQPSEVIGGDDASHAEWFSLDDVPQLAFDHDFILRKAMQQLRKDIYFEPIGFELLDKEFSMSELQRLYESILGVRFDRRNFEKKMLQSGILQSVEDDDASNPAMSPAPMPPFFGSKKQMCTKSIDALFGSAPMCAKPAPPPPMDSDTQEDSLSRVLEPARRKPGRKGRKFSFNKDQYERFKQDKNFRFEF
jgi:8-oxo-dGTP diphosphatase